MAKKSRKRGDGIPSEPILEEAERIYGEKRTPTGAGNYMASELLVAVKELKFKGKKHG